jgi:hypothetical protein
VARARERRGDRRGRHEPAQQPGEGGAAPRPDGAPGGPAREAEPREEQHERPQRARSYAAQRPHRPLRQQGQHDHRHDGEARRRAQLGGAQPPHERVEPPLLDQQQPRDGDGAAREGEVAQPGRDAGGQHDQRGDLRGGVDRAPAGRAIAGRDDRRGAREQQCGGQGGPRVVEPAREPRQRAQQRERADAGEARVRPARVSRPLPLDADGRAAECRHPDAQRALQLRRHAWRTSASTSSITMRTTMAISSASARAVAMREARTP